MAQRLNNLNEIIAVLKSGAAIAFRRSAIRDAAILAAPATAPANRLE